MNKDDVTYNFIATTLTTRFLIPTTRFFVLEKKRLWDER